MQAGRSGGASPKLSARSCVWAWASTTAIVLGAVMGLIFWPPPPPPHMYLMPLLWDNTFIPPCARLRCTVQQTIWEILSVFFLRPTYTKWKESVPFLSPYITIVQRYTSYTHTQTKNMSQLIVYWSQASRRYPPKSQSTKTASKSS